MRNYCKFFGGLILAMNLVACTQTEAKPHCPNYGLWCSKTSINTWSGAK